MGESLRCVGLALHMTVSGVCSKGSGDHRHSGMWGPWTQGSGEFAVLVCFLSPKGEINQARSHRCPSIHLQRLGESDLFNGPPGLSGGISPNDR